MKIFECLGACSVSFTLSDGRADTSESGLEEDDWDKSLTFCDQQIFVTKTTHV